MTPNDAFQFDPTELRKAIRVLEQFVNDERARPTPETTAALDVYIVNASTANERLEECQRLALIGQRSEALRQVQIFPDALDMIRDLQFKNHDWLPEVCAEFGMTSPPTLAADAARRLNEAYALEKDQQTLLREHRLLALGREPLRRRLDVLRLIEKRSDREAFWQDDVTAYEQRRIEEVRAALADPRTLKDWDGVQEMHKEAEASKATRTPYPIEIVDALRKARNRLVQKAAQEELAPVVDQFDAAIASDDIDRVKGLIDQANDVAAKCNLAPTGELMAPVRDAERWFRERKEDYLAWKDFQGAVDDLRNALDERLDWHYIQAFYLSAQQFVRQYNWQLPDDVADTFRARADARKTLWIVGGGLGTITLLGAVVAAMLIFR